MRGIDGIELFLSLQKCNSVSRLFVFANLCPLKLGSYCPES